MKKYFKSLLPTRWILLLVFNLLSLTILLMYLIVSKIWFPTAYLYILGNVGFWFIVDYVFGIGQKSIWDRNNEPEKNDDNLIPD